MNNIKYHITQFYKNNPLLTYLIVADLVFILVFGGNIFEALFNAYLIYFGGSIFRYYMDARRMLNIVIGGAVVGMAFNILAYPHLPYALYAKSAFTSGSIALFIAAATYVPNMEVLLVLVGRVKLKWIAIVFAALDILNMMHPGAIMGDLMGMAFGFVAIYFGRNRSYTKTPNFLKWFMRPRGPYYKKPKKKKSYSNPTRQESDAEYNARKKREQDEIDAILEKIKKKGYDSLTAAEKKKLFDQGNNG